MNLNILGGSRVTAPLIARANEWDKCTRCDIGVLATHHVHGRGDANADILFLGEAPGRTEDKDGRPFIGDSGRVLQRAVNEIQEVYPGVGIWITNTVLCRPTDHRGGPNRPPTDTEQRNCESRLIGELNDIMPTYMIIMGSTARYWFERNCSRFPWRQSLAVYHPAYIVRAGGPNSPIGGGIYRNWIKSILELISPLKGH